VKPPSDRRGAAAPRVPGHSAGRALDAEQDQPKRHPAKRVALGIGAVALPFLLGGCGLPTFWAYKGSTTQGHDEFLMWAGTFIAALAIGGIVTLLILYPIIFNRRKTDEIPRQFQYHGGLEVFYTITPIVLVLIIFAFTVISENHIDALANSPAVDVKVTAFQWGWEFQYPSENITVLGHTTQDPDMVLPAGQTAQITLVSQDVIHGFYVPEFNFSRYAQPGVTNKFDLSVNKPGDYRGQCTQLCGLYHALMFFHVTALPPAQFQAWLARNSGRSFIGESSHLAASETGALTGSG
jgi:cytochrome c oxidase subunit II